MNLTKPQLQNLLNRIIPMLPPKDRERLAEAPQLNCVFVDRQKGRLLNRTFRGHDYATDVLSFAPIESGSIGELVFCTPVLKRQAKQHRLSPKNEFLYLFIHGILHLLGYEHEKSDKAAKRMYRLQDSIFAEILGRRVEKTRAAARHRKKKARKNGARNRTLRRKK